MSKLTFKTNYLINSFSGGSVFICQNLTSATEAVRFCHMKMVPALKEIKYLLRPWTHNRCSNEAERANYDIYDDFSVVRVIQLINPFSPHDALKHHFTSLKT